MSLAIVRIGVVVLFAMALAHFGMALTYTPRYTPVHQLLSEMNFERVRVLGRITAISVNRGAYGSPQVRIEIEQTDTPWVHPDLRSISARLEGEGAGDFLKMEEPLNKGDLIEVAASLFAGEGFRHLSVSSPQFIRVIERRRPADAGTDSAPEVTVQELLGNAEKYKDKTVRIRNAVVAGAVDGVPVLRITDPGQPERELVVFGYEGKAWNAGAKVSVRGQFVFYEKKGYWEIKIPRGDLMAVAAVPENNEGR